MRALFVDDEREFLELMEKRLSRRGVHSLLQTDRIVKSHTHIPFLLQ